MLFKPFDFCIAIPLLGAVIASFAWAYADTGGRSTVNLKSEGGEWVFPLDAVETMSVSGPLGDTVIAISESTARIISSPCLNQTCVAAGALHSPGQWAACLPNRVMLYVGEGEKENNVDAAAW
ncbi:MAG: NusG domain II-containing protein [Treponema sp.]|jgi:hypothetical protein|nr:NusG domain II-containing protein [Treponema sp.]